MLKRLLGHPLTRGCDIDDPQTTLLRREIIRDKGFLRQLYAEWYARIAAELPPPSVGPALEIGAGAGFMKDFVPGLVVSEVFLLPGIDVVLSGVRLPLRSGALRGIAMTEVLHHIPDAEAFLDEAARCVRPGGTLVMLEPWVSRWSRWVYAKLHHEPFMPQAAEWRLPRAGPLSGANGALPWMIFERDRARFCARFPAWKIRAIEPMMPFSYLLSGGVGWRSFAPALAYRPWRLLEACMRPWVGSWAMFALIVLERTDMPATPATCANQG